MSYIYDQKWHAERQRLEGMERLWDDGTFALLERLGVGPGSRVAEVGAGAGSVVRWLADKVGPTGHVLATDVDLGFLDMPADGVTTLAERDIRREPLPAEQFDVVHARLLVEHIGLAALGNMLAGVRPGGWLLIEDYDAGCRGWYPDDPVAQRVGEVLLDIMSRRGYDPILGRKLPSALTELGLTDVMAEGRSRLFRSGTTDVQFYKLSVQALRDRLVESGRVTAEEVDDLVARMEKPGRISLSALMVACWGRKR